MAEMTMSGPARRYGASMGAQAATAVHHTMVSMARSGAEKAEGMAVEPDAGPEYPYGLSLSLSEGELEKLKLGTEYTIGDTIHLVAMARVTSISAHENGCRIELQIEQMSAENEDKEAAGATA